MSNPKANCVFNNYELLGTICTYSTQKDIVHIACSSRLAFGLAAPRIWNTLKSVQPLLMLLSPEVEKGVTGTIIITLPAFSPRAFERFNLYGPFIQNLAILKLWNEHGGAPSPFLVRGWTTLTQRVQLAPLLPNLVELKFSGQFARSDEVLLWTSSFISPSLRTLDIRTTGQSGIIPLSDTVTTLVVLAQKCPRLQTLGHNFRLRDTANSSSDRGAVLQMMLLPVACSHLQNLQHLSCLQILGNFISSESLVAISQLPHLRTLLINQVTDRNGDMPHILKSTQLGDNSFPALSELCLAFRLLEDFLAIWETNKLTQNLGTIGLKFIPSANEGSSIFQEDALAQILPVICKHSPCTKNLTLQGAPSKKLLPVNSTDLAWNYLTQLPLSHLTLVNFKAHETFIKDTLPVLHELLVLELPDQSLNLNHLMYLGRFPKLQRLSSNFEHLEPPIPHVQSHTTAPLQTIVIHRPLAQRLEIKSADKIARFLLSLWPNLQQVTYKDEHASQPDLDLLNLHIRVIQGVAETEKNISSYFGTNPAPSLLDRRLSSF